MEFDTSDYYGVLGIPLDATIEDVKKAYRLRAVQTHPDKNPSASEEAELKFKLVAEAYQVLSNSHLRAQYDVELMQNARRRRHRGPTLRFSAADPEFSFTNPRALFRAFFGGTNEVERVNALLRTLGHDPDGAVRIRVRARGRTQEGEWGEWSHWEGLENAVSAGGYIVGSDGLAGSGVDAVRLPAVGATEDSMPIRDTMGGEGLRYKQEQMEKWRAKVAREKDAIASSPPGRPLSAAQEYRQGLLEEYRRKKAEQEGKTTQQDIPHHPYVSERDALTSEALKDYRAPMTPTNDH